MRQLRLAIVLWTLLLAASSVSAQAAIAAASVNPTRLPPSSRITLRPAPGLEELASKIARVLVLRGDTTVELGPAPPPWLLEAVPAGNVALARAEDSSIYLVMGAALGASFEARVTISPGNRNIEEDVRALALAIEALRDRAIESRASQEPIAPSVPPTVPTAPTLEQPSEPSALEQPMAAEAPLQPTAATPAVSNSTDPSGPAVASSMDLAHRDEGAEYPRLERSEPSVRVLPLLYLSLYGGASSESNTLRTGIATGGGLCVLGQCVLLSVEYPLPINMEAGGDDVRYRYPTFSCSFYSRPFKFGRFTPAASVGLLSRIGHFERDMGVKNGESGLDTDLAVRGTLEGAFEIVDSVDVVAEAGLDYALDRWQVRDGASITMRGSRVSPWLQAAIRIRPR